MSIIDNKKSLEIYANIARNIKNATDVKHSCANDFSQYDVDFVLKYISIDSKVLDLGAGTGLLTNKIYDKIAFVTAVEPFSEFTKYIISSPSIRIVNSTIQEYNDTEQYDIILLFGVVQYFNYEQVCMIYSKLKSNLRANGKLIIKNQFGVKEDVVIDGYSEHLNKYYCSEYRFIHNEIEILKQCDYVNIQFYDIYPPECNRWNNTHYYAIVADCIK